MSRILILICIPVLLLDNISGEDVTQETIGTVQSPEMTTEEINLISPDMEKTIKTLEALATSAEKLNLEGDAPEEDIKNIYADMADILDGIIEAVKNSNNAYKFMKAKGIDRIVPGNLKGLNDDIKTRTLILLKVLFEVAPTTTTAVIPITVVDRLLDVFEMDNLALKAHSLDVLCAWLPDNPRVQARVMKIKGLAPFYEQVSKLDTAVIKTLLDLFNKILKEHLKARNDAQRTVVDNDKMKFYLRIGLLEYMSTPTVCNGLLNIFAKTWSYNTADNNIIVTVFDMIKNIQPFCVKIYQGKAKAKKLFVALQDYVKEPENIAYIESSGLNISDVSLVINNYVEKLRLLPKDEM